MAKYLKRYNKETNEWEIVSAPDVTIINQLSGGTEISDTDVIVTNYKYSDDGEVTTLDDTLSVISDDISRLQRNVSWLGEHGGGGGQGGGGYFNAYGIVIISPIVENKTVYIETSSFTVKFKITGGTGNDTFQYRYIFDGTERSNYASAKAEEEITVVIPNINSVTSDSRHSFEINAITPLSTNLSESFRIYESALNLSLNTTLNNVINGEVLMPMNGNGMVYFDIKNGVIGSNTTLNFSCNGTSSGVSYVNDTSSIKSIPINIWSVIDQAQVNPNGLYAIQIYAQATLGTTVNNKTDVITFSVRINNPEEMSIYFDGLVYKEDAEAGIMTPLNIEQSDRLKFNFRVYLPTLVTDNAIFYAIKLTSPDNNDYFISGVTFDDDAYNTNVLDSARKTITIQTPLSPYNVGDGWIVTVKAWSNSDKTLNATNEGIFNIIESNMDIFPRQHNKRYTTFGSVSADTCLFAWGADSLIVNGKWESKVLDYMPSYSSAGIPSAEVVTAYITPYNTDGRNSGFIVSDAVPYMRLQNESYAIADMSNTGVSTEIQFMTNNENSYGFDISVTFKSDIHADNEKTVFFWGTNNGQGELSNGIKISLEKAQWYIHGDTATILTAYLRQGQKNTVDFLYDGSKAFIYVNGVINAVESVGRLDASTSNQFPTKAYFAADSNGNSLSDFSDINVYEFAVYTQALNPLQIVVNGKNARLNGNGSDTEIVNEYKEWKRNNLIYNEESVTNKALSYLIGEDGSFSYDATNFSQLQNASPIPIVRIDTNGYSQFTKEVFHTSYDNKSVTANTYACVVEYYNPENKQTVQFNGLISLQGTSTLGYYIKNLELIVNEPCPDDPSKKKLFQPREDWFPENEFTLKADVVDSAHANNATIGSWINSKCGLMEENPAMKVFTDEYRPIDKNSNDSIPAVHADTRPGSTGAEINFDEKVTIKHNLEGFPVILLIQFANSQGFDLIGIYSFNLGRFSYYNMGMKFLKEFSRRTETNVSGTVPALINHYVEYGKDEVFGGANGVKTSDIFSYEFGADADDNDTAHQTWTQDHKSILQLYGSFNFNGAAADPHTSVGENDPIWDRLSNLFTITATMGGTQMAQRGFEGKQKFIATGGSLIPAGGNPYDLTNVNMSTFNEHMSIQNAIGYFIVASALGMVDSLGKNLTLRTWDGGQKWWTCFYDMDTALGLSNEGAQSISETAFIDTFHNENDANNATQLVINYHDRTGGYNAYYSKLWAIFRDDLFLYETGHQNTPYYNTAWTAIRQVGGALESYSNFVSLMESQIGNCGELIYDYDYDSKYIGPGANLSMLHGTRIEYVRNWLKNRLYFLDGVFEDANAVGGNFSDSPFYRNSVNITNMGHLETIGYIPYTFRTTAPTFITINTGNSDKTDMTHGKYFIPAYTDTEIHAKEHTSIKQTAIGSSCMLTKLVGLTGIDVASLNTNQNFNDFEVLTALVDFNISGTKFLQNNPIIFENVAQTEEQKNGVFMYHAKSSLESIDVSNTKFADNTGSVFSINLTDYNKVKYINISNSPVSNLVLPASILQSLYISNSNIDNFTLENQPIISNIDFTGCKRMQRISLNNCAGLTSLNVGSNNAGLSGLTSISVTACNGISTINIMDNSNLSAVTIANCSNVETITISGNSKLKEIKLIGNNSLKTLIIAGCLEPDLQISVSDSMLETLMLETISTSNPIVLPAKSYLGNLSRLSIRNLYNFGGLQYGNDAVEYFMDDFGNHYVLDITPLTSLTGENLVLRNIDTLKYMRVRNDDGVNKLEPFEITNGIFEGTTNIVKIFGYIKICGQEFSGMKNFYLNHDSERYADPEIEDPVFVYLSEDEYYTNILLEPENGSISSWFSNTNLDIYDAYYVLLSCDETITDISNLFSGCDGIETSSEEPLKGTAFIKCINVNNINGIFNGCHINGLLSSPIYDEDDEEIIAGNVLLEPLIDNLTEFEYVFSGEYEIAIDACFFPYGCKIKNIKGFNPRAQYGGFHVDSVLLSNLEDLEIIESSFNNTLIDFSRDSYDATELFMHNTKLKAIKNSFVNVGGFGTLRNIFGEYSNDENLYPKAISSITHSFIFGPSPEMRGTYEASHEPINGEPGDNIAFPIGNSLFKRLKSSIVYITNQYAGENKTDSDFYETYNVNCGSFTGPNLMKYLANDTFEFEDENGNTHIENDDCNGQGFPYELFSGCTKLKEATSIFEGIKNLKNYNSSEQKETPIDVSLPNNMLSGCTALTNVSRMFKDMSSSIRCRLTNNEFKDLSLVNVDEMFRGIYIIGKIPAKLFYQEKEMAYAETVGLTESQANDLGISDESGVIETAFEPTTFSGTYKAINPTIASMASVLSDMYSTDMTSYSAETSSLDDITEDNPNYNPIKYITNGNSYTLNENYDPYKKIWNKYVFDNGVNFYLGVQDIISNMGNDEYGNPLADANNIPDVFTSDYINGQIPGNVDTTWFGFREGEFIDGDKSKFTATNYLCPPDLFRYCANIYSTNISYALSNGSGVYNYNTRTISGLRGKIPVSIFEPLSALTAVTGVFSSNLAIFPYLWANGTTSGQMYDNTLLSPLTNVEDLSGLFSSTKIWGLTTIPSGLFNGLSKITSIAGLWAYCSWVLVSEDARNVLPNNIFNGLSGLTDISYLFVGNGTSSIPMVYEYMFSSGTHKSINNCSSFMENANQTTGIVPAFWDWTPEPKNYSKAYKGGVNEPIALVTNRGLIPERYYREP